MYRIAWKRLLILMGGLAVLILIARGCAASCRNDSAATEVLAVDEPAVTSVLIRLGTPEPTQSTDPGPEASLSVFYETVQTKWITVYDHKQDRCVQMNLEEYVLGVVSGEMPVSFAPEALKAQAVATRTYSLYQMRHGGCGTCADADICTNSQCCQAYASADKLKERWGDEFNAKYGKLAAAVMDTAGQVLLYDGDVIDALYHGSSAGGFTEDSERVFSATLPYLRSVSSDLEEGSRQTGEERFAFDVFCGKVNEKYPDAALTASALPGAVEILSVYPSGRVEAARLGGVTLTGKQVRGLLGLDSAMFTISYTDTEIVFSTKGFGHGVGMSQAGANGMALAGSTYDLILLHYYTGVTLGDVATLVDP